MNAHTAESSAPPDTWLPRSGSETPLPTDASPLVAAAVATVAVRMVLPRWRRRRLRPQRPSPVLVQRSFTEPGITMSVGKDGMSFTTAAAACRSRSLNRYCVPIRKPDQWTNDGEQR